MGKKSWISGMALALSLTVFGSGFASAASNQPVKAEGISYVALGDSLAAGQTPYGERTGTGYADMLAGKIDKAGYLGSWTKRYAYSGATSGGVLGQAAAARDELKKADVVTVHAGANDLLGYVLPILTAALATGTQPAVNPAEIMSRVQTAGMNIAATVQTIKQANPEAKVLVIGYYNALPYLPESIQQSSTLPIINTLNTAIQRAAEASGATYVDISAAFAANPFAYLPNPEDIHPNLDGYQAITGVLWSKVQPALPALKASHILGQAEALPLDTSRGVANALVLAMQAQQIIRALPASPEKTHLTARLDSLFDTIEAARLHKQHRAG
ncbi:SGNH/GDSL hydrolase family protein [Ectobacillus ponti]|uniref:SGNH/GDSL hydrolase family protein n=1 Tax=Ectobacillus ponti TaxID=2961894 RepID=A0AA42BNB6_9BACI|nr:SGNH/GDSL hydrolase family protein [Ectobacillus ponti]MCP8967810.1 SGNH/GDSL hydrolase family protein [Ectobacillus ponti]